MISGSWAASSLLKPPIQMQLIYSYILAYLLSPIALADQGGVVDGGGSLVQGKVFEEYLLTHKPVDPHSIGLGGETELQRFGSLSPSLAKAMSSLYKKKWYTVPPALLRQLTPEQTGIPLKSKVAIVQDQAVVFVDQSWLRAVKNKPAEISAMVQHELWQNIRVNTDPSLPPAKVWQANLEVLAHPSLTASDLTGIADKYGFGTYGTAAEFKQATARAENDHRQIQKLCASKHGDDLSDSLTDLRSQMYDERDSLTGGLYAEFDARLTYLFHIVNNGLPQGGLDSKTAQQICETAKTPLALVDHQHTIAVGKEAIALLHGLSISSEKQVLISHEGCEHYYER